MANNQKFSDSKTDHHKMLRKLQKETGQPKNKLAKKPPTFEKMKEKDWSK